MVLLDTNVISELVRRTPDPAVLSYLRSIAPDSMFTAAVCEAEIRYGLARMPVGRRREDLAARIEILFAEGFRDQVLSFDGACAVLYGEIRARREASGRPIEVEDAMIAATTRVYGAVLATRNGSDFVGCDTMVVDPWRTPAA